MSIERFKAYSRFVNKSILGNEKAEVWVGGLKDYVGGSKKGKCEECGRDIFFIDKLSDVDDMVKKNSKKICPYCVLKNKDLDFRQRQLMEDCIGAFEND